MYRNYPLLMLFLQQSIHYILSLLKGSIKVTVLTHLLLFLLATEFELPLYLIISKSHLQSFRSCFVIVLDKRVFAGKISP